VGSFVQHFGTDIDCYVLDDHQRTAVISKRGMGPAIGLGKRGDRLMAFVNSQAMDGKIGRELREKLENPVIFQRQWAAAKNPAERPGIFGGAGRENDRRPAAPQTGMTGTKPQPYWQPRSGGVFCCLNYNFSY